MCDAYLKYFEACYGGISALSRKELVNIIKLSGKYVYKRPHVSRKASNRYAFTGLVIKENFKDEFPAIQQHPELDAFYDKLSEINDLIPTNLYTEYPVDVRIDVK